MAAASQYSMSTSDREFLRKNREYLMQYLLVDDVWPLMTDTFDENCEDLIKAEQTPQKRILKLLELLPRRGAKAFNAFLVATYKVQDWLANELAEKKGVDLNAIQGFNRVLYTDAYFRACQNGVAKNTRISVIIVGQDRGGKTSLKKHLLGQSFDSEELSTNGIEVDVVVLTDENAEDPWEGKETTFLTSTYEANESVLKCTAKLVTEKEQNQKSKTDGISFESEETLTEEEVDKIDKLRNNDVNSESPSTRVILHDFAGQSIFYDTHFCFLKTLCPYLLVVDISSPLDKIAKPRFKFRDSERDLRDPSLETNFDYLVSWLTVLARLSDVICSEISPDNQPKCFKLPPVVIALTQSDQCKAEDIVKVKNRIVNTLHEKAFQNVFEEIHIIDNTLPGRNSDEIRKLRRTLYDLCKDILEQQSPMPVRWLRLEGKLGHKMLKDRLKHITLEDCREVAKLCDVDDIDSALDFLHNRGIIVHHKESPVVVLDPRWLMDLFTKIITVPEVQNRDPIDARFNKLLSKGILMRDYLQRNVDGQHLEDLMKQFSLICLWEYEGDEAYIVPSVAPFLEEGSNVQKELSKSQIASIFVKFDLSCVPIGFFTRFQTSMMSSCKEEKLLNKTPELFCNFTRLVLNDSEDYFFVYLIKIPTMIKVGVVPGDESKSNERDRANHKFVSNLKRVLLDCTERVKNEEPQIYRNATASLVVKCSVSCCIRREEPCLQHGTAKCDHDECGHFWLLEELQTRTKDIPCPYSSRVRPERFSLDRVRPWLDTDGPKEPAEDERRQRRKKGQASGNSSSSNFLAKPCECTCFVAERRKKPDRKFEKKPRVFPVVSGKKIAGTAFVFKDHVISWSACEQPTCEQPTCQMIVNDTKNIRSIPLHRASDDGLLVGTLPEELRNSVYKFKEATPSSKGAGTKLFMASRRTVCGCSGLVISRLSKICPVKNKGDGYVRKSGGSFKSFPLGAPVVNCKDGLVGVTASFEDKKLTVLRIDHLINVF